MSLKSDVHLATIPPRYDPVKKCNFLPFEGMGDRVKVGSRHNFVMKGDDYDAGKTKKGKLQMGKMASGTFSLDFRAPFTPIQAFFVALAHLEE